MSTRISAGGGSLPTPHWIVLWRKGWDAEVQLLNELSEVNF